MRIFRNIERLLFAVALSTLTLPASAANPSQGQDKLFGVEFLLPSMAIGPDGTLQSNPFYNPGAVVGDFQVRVPVTVIVYIKNEAPPSTAASNAGSLTFDLAPSLVVVDPPICPRGQCSINGNTVTVTNISPPIQAKEIFPITLHVNTCVVATEAFISTPSVYTGSQVGNGQPFKLFTGDPTFQFQTKLATRGTAYPIDFTTTTAPAVTGISCGNIACKQSFTIGNLDPSGADYRVISGWRGLNTDGTCSEASHLSYFVTNKLGIDTDPTFPATRRSVHFVWPGDPNNPPVFAYKVIRDTDDTGTQWNVAWLPKPSLSPVSIAPPACNGGLLSAEPTTFEALPLPKAYGVLTQDVKTNTSKFKVDTGINAPPTITSPGLPIVIGTERMLVTSIDNSGWSVTRTVRSFHPAGSTVASTPMPLLDPSINWPSPYQAGTPAQMCLVWTNGESAWVIDGSDGWVRVGQ